MNSLKWGVLSTAKIGRTQVIPAIQRSSNGEVIAIASRQKERVEEVAKELSIPKAYDTYEALLDDQEIDAVYIPLPNALHKEWVIKAAEKNKHVLCEKPVGIEKEELDEMVQACEDNGVKFMEAFMYQFHPQHQKVKGLIQEDVIGDVAFMRASFAFLLEDRSNIRLSSQLGGGAMYDVGCYTLHSIRYILGEEPVTAYANAHYHDELDVDTKMSGILSFADGKQAAFDCSFDTIPRQEYEVIGSKGSIKVKSAYRPDTNENMAGEIHVTNADGEITVYAESGDQYALMAEEFASAILEDRPLKYTFDQMAGQMKVLDAVYTSSKKGEVVKL
ncbi:Gfo/Idh/MocA family oxidoreductase [Gracilibacillus sp. YIM 98692]|uniref:Gfo/Idh/MocA family protein n=1 Tax=Gracilibacillus sp. YIM 98692 TaxID=2663532 RepID=UPI0013D84D41|nr:Gfo/Idh/MocA family oxidoreductase [Gracilibacillus sp. YIM 98692]